MFIGFLLFLAVFLMAFWLMLFIAGFLPFWIFGYFIDLFHDGARKKAEVSTGS